MSRPTDAPESFEARLAAAQARNAPVDPVRLAGGAMGQGFRFAVEIVITTVVGSAIGWQLDRWLGTKPWLLLLFMLLGVAAGFRSLFRAVAAEQRLVDAQPVPAAAPPEIETDVVKPQLEQFEIHRMVPATTLGYDVSFTNASLFMLITLVGVWAFLTLGMRRATIVPGRWQSAVEMIHEFVTGMVDENIGHGGRAYVPFIFALFVFILFANILGLLPFAFAVTSHIWVTFAFAAFIFLLCVGIGFARHGLHFFELFVPPQTPLILLPLIVLIELISFLSRPLTLSVRLFANMTAGHILLQVFAGFIVSLGLAGGFFAVLGILPLAMNVALYALELLVAVVQAYVFALLTCVYLNDSINLSH